MSRTISIRSAKVQDAAGIGRVTRLAFAPYRRARPPLGAVRVSNGTIRRQIRSRSHTYGVATHRGTIIGTIRYRRRRRHLHVSRLGVLPAYQGNRLGLRLLRWAERRARRAGKTQIRGEVRAGLPRLLRYYQRYGFIAEARIRHYIPLHKPVR